MAAAVFGAGELKSLKHWVGVVQYLPRSPNTPLSGPTNRPHTMLNDPKCYQIVIAISQGNQTVAFSRDLEVSDPVQLMPWGAWVDDITKLTIGVKKFAAGTLVCPTLVYMRQQRQDILCLNFIGLLF